MMKDGRKSFIVLRTSHTSEDRTGQFRSTTVRTAILPYRSPGDRPGQTPDIAQAFSGHTPRQKADINQGLRNTDTISRTSSPSQWKPQLPESKQIRPSVAPNSALDVQRREEILLLPAKEGRCADTHKPCGLGRSQPASQRLNISLHVQAISVCCPFGGNQTFLLPSPKSANSDSDQTGSLSRPKKELLLHFNGLHMLPTVSVEWKGRKGWIQK